MPVLPDVASIRIESESIWFALSASSIIARPILSFTDPKGLKNSNLAIMFPDKLNFFLILFSFTIGVFPIV